MAEELLPQAGWMHEPNALQISLSLLASFVLSQVVCLAHRWTQVGAPSSRSFTHAMALGPLVTCLLTLVIGNNLARGLGMLGAVALIRFRTDIRDQRDIVFLFANLAIGIAA